MEQRNVSTHEWTGRFVVTDPPESAQVQILSLKPFKQFDPKPLKWSVRKHPCAAGKFENRLLGPTTVFNRLHFHNQSGVSPWCGFYGCPGPSVELNRDLGVVGAGDWGTQSGLP
jgi:hypothetical protein